MIVVAPGMDFSDRSNRAGPDQLDHAAKTLAGVISYAHLCDQVLFPGHLGGQSSLEDIVGQRLLAVDVLAHFHGHHADRDVRMVGRGDHNGIKVLFFPVE